MAARRAYWKGYLKLSLVTCPVALYPASSQSEKTRFHQISRKTGNRLRQQMVDEETGRVVDKDDKGRGYDLGNGKYVEIEPDELEAVEIESTHTIDIDKFVPEADIDKRYYERRRQRRRSHLASRSTNTSREIRTDQIEPAGNHCFRTAFRRDSGSGMAPLGFGPMAGGLESPSLARWPRAEPSRRA